VAYRDFSDSSDNLETFNLSSDIKEVINFISKLDDKGGDDPHEDVAGGLEAGLNLGWANNSFKIVILVADYPNHGSKYGNYSDRYPHFPIGIPKARKEIANLAEIYADKEIDFNMLKITDYTDIMYNEI
jgi:hypothetical protein